MDSIIQLLVGSLSLLSLAFWVLVSLGVFMVVWGIFKFIVHADDETERSKGRSAIFWGIIGVFLMVSVWGLVNILINTFDLDNNAVIDNPIPSVPASP